MPGVYYLQLEDKVNLCKSGFEPVVVEEHKTIPIAVIYAEPSTVIDCVIKSIVLTSEREDNVNYVWSLDGEIVENVQELEVDETGSYGLFAVDTLTGCMNEADLVITSFIEYPIIYINLVDTLDCNQSVVTIDASSSQQGPNISSNWLNQNGAVIGSDETTISVTDPGTYYFTSIDNNNGCENIDTVVVTSFENDVDVDLTPNVEFQSGDIVQLDASVNIDLELIDSIYWESSGALSCNDCLNPIVEAPTEGLYTITVIDIYGCIGIATARLIEVIEYDVIIPNIFNPEKDKFNLSASDEVVEILEMSVYDRWGGLIFHTDNILPNDPEAGWDAKFKGEFVEIGVYLYKFEILIVDGTKKTFVGDVTVLR